MGDRSLIVIDSRDFEVPLTFYGHWAGTDNLAAVQDVIATTDRIGDGGYLAAQIFHKFAFMYGRYEGSIGFGIYAGNLDGWADNPTVYVNADTGEIRVDGEDEDE
jgi:hypothetical protein